MILAPLYAVLIWYLVARHRRRVKGYLIALIGGGLVALVVPAILLAGRYFRAELLTPPMAMLLVGESLAVGGIGVFIASLPRPPAHAHCPRCHYDLTGHGHEHDVTCPECGEKIPPRRVTNK